MQRKTMQQPEPEPMLTTEQLHGSRLTKTASAGGTARAVIFPSRFASPGTALDAEVYRQLLDDASDDQCHGPVHLMPGSGLQPQERPPLSPLTLHIETLQLDNLPQSEQGDGSLHAWMVNPEVGYPDCLSDAALSCVDVVLCKSRAAVALMQEYKAQHSKVARYRILHTGHTSTDLRSTVSVSSSNVLPEVVFRSSKTGTYMYLINPAIERDDANGGTLVVIYRLTAVEVAVETSQHRRRYMNDNAGRLMVMDTSEVDGLDEHLENYADPTRCSCLLRCRSPEGVTAKPQFELLLPFTPLPEPDDLLATRSNLMCGFEDPRLFRFRNRLWVICGFLGNCLSCASSTVAAATLKNESQSYRNHLVIFPLESCSVQDQGTSAVLLHYEGRYQVEKNWMPFEHGGGLFIVYSVSPHVILSVDIETGLCTEVYATHPPVDYEILEQGEAGNGAPPVQVTLSSGEVLMIGAAHIRRIPRGGQWVGIENVGRRAVRKTFFYAFEAVPPFRIRSVGPLRTLLMSQQYQHQHRQQDTVKSSALAEPLVEFLSGMCVDPTGQKVLLAFGVDDAFACTQTWPLGILLSDLGLNTCELPRQMVCVNSKGNEVDKAGMDYNQALHVGGKSQWKNTESVLRCWVSECSQNEMLPPLTVVAWGPLLERLRRCFADWPWPHADGKQQVNLPNVTILTEKLQQKDLRHHMATCGVHICPSACEGFGHIINEARSLGAVIVTTAAQPMNELVTDGLDGITVPVTRCTTLANNVLGACTYEIEGEDDPTVSGLATAMSRVLALGEHGCRRMGMLARLRFERERRSFEDALRAFGKATVEHGRGVLSMSDHALVSFEPDDQDHHHHAGETCGKTDRRSTGTEQSTWADYLRRQRVNHYVHSSDATSVNDDIGWDGLPARLLEVQPEHYVLDLCAGANGGQSCCELLRMMHCSNTSRTKQTESDEHVDAMQTCSSYIPNGVLIANDLDLKRLSAFVDQARKQIPLLCAPLLATRCDAANFPTLQCVVDTSVEGHVEEQAITMDSEPASTPQAEQQGPRQYKQKFDRVLCCPPSSNSSISAALTLHTTQVAVLRRGLELLSSGGVLVYAVRTLDPVQGEAVVAASVRSLRALPEWGQHGIEFLHVDSKIACASVATTTAAVATCATVFKAEEENEEARGYSTRIGLHCQPALDDWSVPHPNFLESTSSVLGGVQYESDKATLAEGMRVLYRSFDDVPKDLRRTSSSSQSSSSSSMTTGLIKSTAFPPNFGYSKSDDDLLREMKKHCRRVGDRFFAILRKRTQQEIQQVDKPAIEKGTGSSSSSSSSTVDCTGTAQVQYHTSENSGDKCSVHAGPEHPDANPGNSFEVGAEVEVITPQNHRWPAVVKGRGKGKKYKGLLQVVFPDGCSFHCDPAQLVPRHQQQPPLQHPVPPTSNDRQDTNKESHQESQNKKILTRKARRNKVVARRPGVQMFDRVDISGAQSIWRELRHTYGLTLDDEAGQETTKDQCLHRQRFPGEALCIARYHKGKGFLYLLSPAVVSLRFRTNCRVVTAGIPCFTRVTTVADPSAADMNAHGCTSSRSVSSWHWRPCHEAIGLIARCCAGETVGVLRLSVPQFTELLRERLLPRSALHEPMRNAAIMSDSKEVVQKEQGGSLAISTTQQQRINTVRLPTTGSVVVVPTHSGTGTSRHSLPLTVVGGAYDGTTAAGVEAMAVCGDLTSTRLTISTSAQTRATFAQILRLADPLQRSQEE